VLTGNGSSLPEVAGDAAVLVDAESSDAIFDGLKKLAADAELRQTLSAAGIARSRYFSWQKSADTLLGHIRACCKRG
jgi:glycosyltransferase involved in cell wall biosynthesis